MLLGIRSIIPIILSSAISSSSCGINDNWHETVENPGANFEEYTQLDWPEKAEVISVGDTHGGFNGDGEFYLVFKTDKTTITKYLNGLAAFEKSWQLGPITKNIGFQPQFGTGGIDISRINNGPEEYSGDPQHIDVVLSDEVYFSAKERCCESIRWHNGSLLIIDPRLNKVWLSVWDR